MLHTVFDHTLRFDTFLRPFPFPGGLEVGHLGENDIIPAVGRSYLEFGLPVDGSVVRDHPCL